MVGLDGVSTQTSLVFASICLSHDFGSARSSTKRKLTPQRSGKMLATSTAAGPAFEGAQITYGMRAAPGAIERVRITPEGVDYEAAMDRNAVPLAGIAMVAWNVFWIAATVRAFARRSKKSGDNTLQERFLSSAMPSRIN